MLSGFVDNIRGDNMIRGDRNSDKINSITRNNSNKRNIRDRSNKRGSQ